MDTRDLPDPSAEHRVGICFYSSEQWARLREVASDPEMLEETYEAWADMMKKNLLLMRESGIRYELIDIDVQKLLLWCKRKRYPVNGSSRAEYAARLLQERDS